MRAHARSGQRERACRSTSASSESRVGWGGGVGFPKAGLCTKRTDHQAAGAAGGGVERGKWRAGCGLEHDPPPHMLKGPAPQLVRARAHARPPLSRTLTPMRPTTHAAAGPGPSTSRAAAAACVRAAAPRRGARLCPRPRRVLPPLAATARPDSGRARTCASPGAASASAASSSGGRGDASPQSPSHSAPPIAATPAALAQAETELSTPPLTRWRVRPIR